MPRPSWFRYKIRPLPFFAMTRMLSRSWSWQSQRWEPKVSPVRHMEWIRVSTGFFLILLLFFAYASATCSLLSIRERKTVSLKSPNLVGRGAEAVLAIVFFLSLREYSRGNLNDSEAFIKSAIV